MQQRELYSAEEVAKIIKLYIQIESGECSTPPGSEYGYRRLTEREMFDKLREIPQNVREALDPNNNLEYFITTRFSTGFH